MARPVCIRKSSAPRRSGRAFAETNMSTWRGKALEYLPGLKDQILGAKDR